MRIQKEQREKKIKSNQHYANKIEIRMGQHPPEKLLIRLQFVGFDSNSIAIYLLEFSKS